MAAGRMLPAKSSNGILISLLLACAYLPTIRCGRGRADRYIRFEPAAKFYSPDSYTTLFKHTETLTVDAAPHLTLLDRNGLIANLTDFTVEGFARIRDPRILTGSGYNQSLDCAAYYRLPIMGTLQHRKPPNPNFISQAGGFQLSCGWSGSAPECCMEVYTAPSDLCPISACVNVPRFTRTPMRSEWFHLSGSVSNALGAVNLVLTDLAGRSYRGSASLGGARLSALPEFPFRVGAQLPFTREGTLMGSSQTDANGFSYRFFRGDVDEIRLWPTGSARSQDPAYYAFNGIAADSCSITTPSNLVIAINVKEGSEMAIFTSPAFNIIAPTSVTPTPIYEPASGFTSMFNLGQAYPLAYKIQFVDPLLEAPVGACQEPRQDYYRAACSTYLDRPPMVRTSDAGEDQARGMQTSSHVRVQRLNGLDYWWVPEAQAPGSVLHMVLADLNEKDTVDLQGFGTVCTAADVSRGDCKVNEASLLAGQPTDESWVRFNYTLYNGDEVVNNIPPEMFFRGLLWRPHERYLIRGDSQSALAYRQARNPMARRIDRTGPDTDVAGADGYVTKLSGDADCQAGQGFCDAVKIDFPDPFPTDATELANFYAAYRCHPSLRGPYRLLCLEWQVPPNRGWNVTLDFRGQTNCPTGQGLLADLVSSYYAVIGYEASPEWLSASENPKFSAVPYTPAAPQSSDCPNCRPSDLGQYVNDGVEEGQVVQVKVGEEERIELYARDRNLDDAVDILPREDPGLPNGASLQPALPGVAETAHNYDCDSTFPCPRPHIYRRVLFFRPQATQVNKNYTVCFYTQSYARRGSYAYEAGSRGSRPRAEVGPEWPSVWTDRCITVRVQPPMSGFVCNGGKCGPSDLERGDEQFTAGSSECSTELEFTVTDFNPVGAGEAKYTIFISKDPENPGPEGMTLDLTDPGQAQQSYKVVWTPQVGLDDKRDGYRTCLIAHDEFFMSTQRLCFNAVVRKCKYCMSEGETLEGVGRRFGVDWLQIYLANPHLTDPDNILPQHRLINLGVLYTVRAGDYLELLSQRFFQAASELQRLNIDVDPDGGIRAGMQMCVMPPVCSVDCLYGTDCYVY